MLLKNVNLYLPEPLGPGSVLIEGDTIAAIYPIGEALPGGVPAIDLRGAALGPGLIDVHTHGADGADLMDGGDAVVRMARFYVEHGVTGFVPATVTAPFDSIAAAAAGVRAAMGTAHGGARVLGVHIEGPFISRERLGAQSPDYALAPTAPAVARLLEIAGDVTRIVTLAPESPGAIEAIYSLVLEGMVVSLGHTVATEAQAQAAFDAGATQVTHLFNGMPPFHHREPGVVGAALMARGVRAEIIADGVHLAPTTVRLALAAKGIDGILLVTDSMAATGCPDGEYDLGPMRAIVRDGEARLPSGALAGSTLTMERALVNVARWTDAGLGGAWQMASLNPARQLGLGQFGRLAPGYQADLTAIDAAGQVVLTMVDGEVAYQLS
jgi:N-acetylglucosamine-6-phosphate deacetylase